MFSNRTTRRLLPIVTIALLAAACSSDGDAAPSTTNPPTTVTATVPATPPTVAAPTTLIAQFEDVCPPTAGPNVRIPWTDLRDRWAGVDPSTPATAELEAGTDFDSGQFVFADGTIVQATIERNKGEIVGLFVVSPVDPQNPMSNLPEILDHWVDMLSITEPKLTPEERVDILDGLGAIGENRTLLNMNGTVTCRQRTYEVAFDIDLASFIFGVDLSR